MLAGNDSYVIKNKKEVENVNDVANKN